MRNFRQGKMKKGTMGYEIGKKCEGLLDSQQYLCTIKSETRLPSMVGADSLMQFSASTEFAHEQ